MTGSFIVDYYLLVFLASCGVFQIIAAHNGFRGMLFFRYRPGAFLFGLALLVAAVAWFFLSEPRNVSDNSHGLNGNEQFAYFFGGLGTGLAFTLIVASLRNWGLAPKQAELPSGLDALRETTYLRAGFQAWRRFRPRFRTKEDRGAETPAEGSVAERATLSG